MWIKTTTIYFSFFVYLCLRVQRWCMVIGCYCCFCCFMQILLILLHSTHSHSSCWFKLILRSETTNEPTKKIEWNNSKSKSVSDRIWYFWVFCRFTSSYEFLDRNFHRHWTNKQIGSTILLSDKHCMCVCHHSYVYLFLSMLTQYKYNQTAHMSTCTQWRLY